MYAITGTVRNGQIILNEPLRWPDGTQFVIEPLSLHDTPGVCEEAPLEAAAIERQLALMDQIEPSS